MKIHTDFPLREISYYKIGPVAKTVLEISSESDVLEAISYIHTKNISRVLVLGLGSNMLIGDDVFDGVVLWFRKADSSTPKIISDGKVEAFSSLLLDDVIQFSFIHNLLGLEWAGGLPSTVGGAVRGNVGAFGNEISSSIQEVRVIDFLKKEIAIQKLSKTDLQFGYRNSFIKQNKHFVVISVVFSLKPGTAEEIMKAKKEYTAHIAYRNENHAVEYPSCGSVFKNITDKQIIDRIIAKWPDVAELVNGKWHGKVAMGYINKRLGFSGFSVGGAQVSEKHANYVINKNNASFSDVLTIIKSIQHRVQGEFGFLPEPEVDIIQ